MIASLHSRTAERTPPLGAGEVVPEDPGAFAAGRGAEGFVPFAMPGLSGLSVGQSAGRPVCRSASLPVGQFAGRPVCRFVGWALAHRGSPAGQSASERVETLVLRQGGGPPRPRFKCQQIGRHGSRKIPGFCRGLFQTTLEVRGGFAARDRQPPKRKGGRSRINPSLAPDCSTVSRESSRKTSLRGIRKASRSRSAVPNPRSSIRNPQSSIPNPQSAIPNPQSPIRRSAAIRRISIACRTSSMPQRPEKGLDVSGGGEELGLESGGAGGQGMFSSGKSCEESRPRRSPAESLGAIYFSSPPSGKEKRPPISS